jgi:hypothetical protein
MALLLKQCAGLDIALKDEASIRPRARFSAEINF